MALSERTAPRLELVVDGGARPADASRPPLKRTTPAPLRPHDLLNEKRRALLVVAASETGLVDEVRRACAALGIDDAAVRELEADGLVRVEQGRATLRFGLVERLFEERLRRDVAELAESVPRCLEGRGAEVHPLAREPRGGSGALPQPEGR